LSGRPSFGDAHVVVRAKVPAGRPCPAPSNEGSSMNVDDMVLVSIDDHIIEPADMFERHMPER
jgi:hypothetical protein